MVGNGDDSHNWREQFAKLDSPPSDRTDRQRRGFKFERVLHAMFEDARMKPRSRFRPAGEEIDGSFLHQGRPMLFEAKWTTDPVPASVLYAFRGKLDGKLSGTLGLFISMGGFAKDAVDALIAGKSVKLLLFDGDDMRKVAMDGGVGIEAAIDFKLRAAAEEGTPFVPLPPPDAFPAAARIGPVVVVEGGYDVAILDALIKTRGSRLRPAFIPARGRLNLPLVALAQPSLLPGVKKLVIVADGEGRPKEVKRDIELALSERAGPSGVRFVVLVFDPDMETAFGLVDPSTQRRPPIHELSSELQRVDLRERAAVSREVKHLVRLLGLFNEDDDRLD